MDETSAPSTMSGEVIISVTSITRQLTVTPASSIGWLTTIVGELSLYVMRTM